MAIEKEASGFRVSDPHPTTLDRRVPPPAPPEATKCLACGKFRMQAQAENTPLVRIHQYSVCWTPRCTGFARDLWARGYVREHPSQAMAAMGVPLLYRSGSLLKKVKPLSDWRSRAGILWLGAPGTGKTLAMAAWLGASVHNFVVAGRLSGVWVSAGDMLLTIRDTFGRGTSEVDACRKFTEPALLCLDDLGCENETDWTRTILYHVFEARLREGLFTVVTSPRTSSEWDLFGGRLASRLALFRVIELVGRDRRYDVQSQVEVGEIIWANVGSEGIEEEH